MVIQCASRDVNHVAAQSGLEAGHERPGHLRLEAGHSVIHLNTEVKDRDGFFYSFINNANMKTSTYTFHYIEVLIVTGNNKLNMT